MPRKTKTSKEIDGAFVLDSDARTLKSYYSGFRLESPMGGYLDVIGVRGTEDGGGLALFECTTSSLRFVLEIPAASRGDKSQVKKQMDEGEDPFCPRHGPSSRLQRVGDQMTCPRCGVPFRKAPR